MQTEKKSVSILLVRHAESVYNRIQLDWKAENNLPIHAKENEELRFNITPEIIDAELTPLGVTQVSTLPLMV